MTLLPAPGSDPSQNQFRTSSGISSSHARDAHAGLGSGSLSASVGDRGSEGGPGETAPPSLVVEVGPPPRSTVASRAAALGIVSPAAWHRQHGRHALQPDLCDWVCLPQSLHDEWVQRLVGAGRPREVALVDILTFVRGVRERWRQSADVPGEDNFAFWRHEWAATHGSNRPAVATSLAQTDPLAGVKGMLRG